jgi:DNA-binding response OmpR family regulator
MRPVADQAIAKPLLIVDDDKELCSLLAERLGEDGYVVHAVHDAREGLERAISGADSLVILDVMLPHKGGMQILRNYARNLRFRY